MTAPRLAGLLLASLSALYACSQEVSDPVEALAAIRRDLTMHGSAERALKDVRRFQQDLERNGAAEDHAETYAASLGFEARMLAKVDPDAYVEAFGRYVEASMDVHDQHTLRLRLADDLRHVPEELSAAELERLGAVLDATDCAELKSIVDLHGRAATAKARFSEWGAADVRLKRMLSKVKTATGEVRLTLIQSADRPMKERTEERKELRAWATRTDRSDDELWAEDILGDEHLDLIMTSTGATDAPSRTFVWSGREVPDLDRR